jgi:hypothetical protein
MPEPAYPAARAIAPRIEAYFAHHHAQVMTTGDTQRAPDAGIIETLIDAAFWASLRREEGVTPKISLAYVSPDHTTEPLLFGHPLTPTAAALARLAPAVERPGIHLGVWRIDGELCVWGTTQHLPPHCFVIEVVMSGLLVVKQRSTLLGKFINVAVLEGDEVKFVDERTAQIPDCPGVLQSLLGFGHPLGPRAGTEGVNVLVQLAASMRSHGRGGALLVTPSGSDEWLLSVITPMLYALNPPFTGLSGLIRTHGPIVSAADGIDDMRHAVEGVAGLTAVDGAMVMNDVYDVLAFGVKITRRKGSPSVERIMVTEPIEGSAHTMVTPGQFGGTRHLSAAQFVHDQRDAIALVASQDGRFTIFKWSDDEEMVHAHRVEALLL